MDMTPLVFYAGDMVFARICPKCGRYVKADADVTVSGDDLEPVYREGRHANATCSRCGRVEMTFQGYYP